MASPTRIDQQQNLYVGGDLIVEGTITGDIHATAGSIGTTELADDAVTSDKLADAVNTSIAAKASKVTSPTENNLAKLTSGGDLADAGVAASALATLAALADETEETNGAKLIGCYLGEAIKLDAVLAGFSAEIERLQGKMVEVTIALNANSGASAADPTLIDGEILGRYEVSGNDQAVASIAIGVDGAVTVTLAANSTAECVYRVLCRAAAPE